MYRLKQNPQKPWGGGGGNTQYKQNNSEGPEKKRPGKSL